jgi:prenyltransferase beta subunit
MMRQVCSDQEIHAISSSHSAGAFGAHPDHDAHLLSTLSAIQILLMQDALNRVDVDRVVKCTVFFLPCDPDTADMEQSSYPCNNRLEYLQATPLAKQIRDFYIVPSTPFRF